MSGLPVYMTQARWPILPALGGSVQSEEEKSGESRSMLGRIMKLLQEGCWVQFLVSKIPQRQDPPADDWSRCGVRAVSARHPALQSHAAGNHPP